MRRRRTGCAASGMRMNRPRTPPVPVLPDLSGPPIGTSSWRCSGADPEPSGRLTLPPVARRALVGDADRAVEVSGVVRGETLVLRTDVAVGRAMTVDARGRVYVPQWLRRHPSFLVGTPPATKVPPSWSCPPRCSTPSATGCWSGSDEPPSPRPHRPGRSTRPGHRPRPRRDRHRGPPSDDRRRMDRPDRPHLRWIHDPHLPPVLATPRLRARRPGPARAHHARPRRRGRRRPRTSQDPPPRLDRPVVPRVLRRRPARRLEARRRRWSRRHRSGRSAPQATTIDQPTAGARRPGAHRSRRRHPGHPTRPGPRPAPCPVPPRDRRPCPRRPQPPRRDIDPVRSTVWLREKLDSVREQPASPSLANLLLDHVSERGGSDGDAVFRTGRGTPITDRFYDRLFARARRHLGWDPRTPLTAHVLRHTAITRVGRIAGSPVAQAFAGHAPPTVTGRYLHATLADVAAAVAAMTAESHPLAPSRPGHRHAPCDPGW